MIGFNNVWMYTHAHVRTYVHYTRIHTTVIMCVCECVRVSEGMRVCTLYMQVDTGRETPYEYKLFVCVCVCVCV